MRESDVAVLSGNTAATSVLAEAFSSNGKEGVFRLVEEWIPSGLKKSAVSPVLRERISLLFPYGLPQVERVTAENGLAKASFVGQVQRLPRIQIGQGLAE